MTDRPLPPEVERVLVEATDDLTDRLRAEGIITQDQRVVFDSRPIKPAFIRDGSTATCQHCNEAITFDTITEPGYLPRTGWRDRFWNSEPLVCYSAENLTHSPDAHGISSPEVGQ